MEIGIFRKALEFFHGSPKVLEREAPRPPVPGSNPVHGSGSASSPRLSAIYGNRLRISGNGPAVQQHLRDLELLPDSFHNKLLGYFARHRKGGIDLIDGPVTDVMTKLRGVTPRGWPKGMTWDYVPGLQAPATKRVILGGQGQHGCVSLAVHETGHAFNRSMGMASDSAEFRQLYGKMGTTSPYLARPGGDGREETFAEGLASWAKNRHMPPDYRAAAMADALSIGTNKQSTGALFDSYYTSLQHGLESRPL